MKQKVVALEAEAHLQQRRIGHQDTELAKYKSKNSTLLKVVGALGSGQTAAEQTALPAATKVRQIAA